MGRGTTRKGGGGAMARQTSKRTVSRARKLRRTMSLPEVLLWRILRQAEIGFRRQHPCGPFVADFYCAAAKVIIEIDGTAHDRGDRPERDGARNDWLRERGYRVMRVPARDVLADVYAVAEAIVVLCREVAPGPSSTSPAGPRSPSPSASPTRSEERRVGKESRSQCSLHLEASHNVRTTSGFS